MRYCYLLPCRLHSGQEAGTWGWGDPEFRCPFVAFVTDLLDSLHLCCVACVLFRAVLLSLDFLESNPLNELVLVLFLHLHSMLLSHEDSNFCNLRKIQYLLEKIDILWSDLWLMQCMLMLFVLLVMPNNFFLLCLNLKYRLWIFIKRKWLEERLVFWLPIRIHRELTK